ncbi:MAG: hypothetical protein ACK5QX_00090 [bacterium]
MVVQRSHCRSKSTVPKAAGQLFDEGSLVLDVVAQKLEIVAPHHERRGPARRVSLGSRASFDQLILHRPAPALQE